jgi:hypothetical protein
MVKKENTAGVDQMINGRWTIDDLKKKVEQDRLKYSKKNETGNGTPTILRVHPENLKHKMSKGL